MLENRNKVLWAVYDSNYRAVGAHSAKGQQFRLKAGFQVSKASAELAVKHAIPFFTIYAPTTAQILHGGFSGLRDFLLGDLAPVGDVTPELSTETGGEVKPPTGIGTLDVLLPDITLWSGCS
jgi:hypothetical protein